MTEPLREVASSERAVGKRAGHVFPLRVYFEDTDAGGVVYYANYLRYAERARSEWLRSLGFESSNYMESDGVAFAVRHCEADFIKPARLDDQLEVVTALLDAGGASLRLSQVVKRGGEDLVRMQIKLACMDAKGTAARLPSGIRDKIQTQLNAIK